MFDQPALEKAVLVPSGEQLEEKAYRLFSSSIIGLLEVTEALLLVGFQTSVCFLWPTEVGLEKLRNGVLDARSSHKSRRIFLNFSSLI